MPAAVPRRFDSPNHAAPRTHLLSNGRYSVMLTAAGSGYSRWEDTAVTRWREDPTCDSWGSYVFLRDVGSGRVWSAGYQPVGCEPDHYRVAFFEAGASISRSDLGVHSTMDILVSGEDDAEARRVSLTNATGDTLEIELTSYAEVVLNQPAADCAHPAFSKMFVQTQFDAAHGALLATRRPGGAEQPPLWLAHFSSLAGGGNDGLQFESDRARFLGRGRGLRDAAAMVGSQPLSNTAGTVLDPIVALRRRVRIAPGGTASVTFWSAIGASRDAALRLVDKYGDTAAFERAAVLARRQAALRLREWRVDPAEADLFQEIAAAILYADSSLRAAPDLLAANQLGQSTLWTYGLSGDRPLVLVRIEAAAGLEVVDQLLRAQVYWRQKGLPVDVVLLNAAPPAAVDSLQAALQAASQSALQSALAAAQNTTPEGATRSAAATDRGVTAKVLREDAMPPAHRDFLQVAARAVFTAAADLRGQTQRRQPLTGASAASPPRIEADPYTARPAPPDVTAAHTARPAPPDVTAAHTPPPAFDAGSVPGVHAVPDNRSARERQRAAALEFFNGLGGFDADAREYVVHLKDDEWTPAPWSNVIANAQFGFLASADGTGSTWSLNAQQNQITPWCNDPVSNAPAEAIYIRDEQYALWSATPQPIRDREGTYSVRHGFGYVRSEHTTHGITTELLQFVPLEDSVKISRLRLTNGSGERRRLTVTYYADWVLGHPNNHAAPFIVTDIDSAGTLLARNPWGGDFSSRIAFMDMGGRQHSHTGDRTEFLGRHGSLARPAALVGGNPLSGRVGGGLDPCGALQTCLSLDPGAIADITLLLGEESAGAAAATLIARYRSVDVDALLDAVVNFWHRTLNVIQVKTPERSMDILLNGWLLYQTLSSRIWGRTAFYQSSGAFGFRDQLQDVMALCVSAPAIARGHILRAAARQFTAGDVQHWWLPGSGAGIQTRIADDRIWLPFVVAHYLEITGDAAVLDEPVAFLGGGELVPDALENYSTPPAVDPRPLFEHCVRALDSSLKFGSHGLPLFGTGDWNDGMNRVGVAGRGESVWMAWFLNLTLLRFAAVAEQRGADANAAVWRRAAMDLSRAIEHEAWDGDWYRRGYYDDGAPLGSASSDECQIDSIAQSWAVICGAGDKERARRAMAAVDARLLKRGDGLLQLFTPPFDRTAHDPGYIKAYPPGLRENGGQYTHAAMWSILAFALQGDGDKAGELFSLLNPINHAGPGEAMERYKVEPYVVCADIYSAPGHEGRGGWTWYTGSAGWMYRAGLEGILGVRVRGASLEIDPCIPRAWPGFEFTYRFGSARYHITVSNPRGASRGVTQAALDGRALASPACVIALLDDGREHRGEITLG